MDALLGELAEAIQRSAAARQACREARVRARQACDVECAAQEAMDKAMQAEHAILRRLHDLAGPRHPEAGG